MVNVKPFLTMTSTMSIAIQTFELDTLAKIPINVFEEAFVAGVIQEGPSITLDGDSCALTRAVGSMAHFTTGDLRSVALDPSGPVALGTLVELATHLILTRVRADIVKRPHQVQL